MSRKEKEIIDRCDAKIKQNKMNGRSRFESEFRKRFMMMKKKLILHLCSKAVNYDDDRGMQKHF